MFPSYHPRCSLLITPGGPHHPAAWHALPLRRCPRADPNPTPTPTPTLTLTVTVTVTVTLTPTLTRCPRAKRRRHVARLRRYARPCQPGGGSPRAPPRLAPCSRFPSLSPHCDYIATRAAASRSYLPCRYGQRGVTYLPHLQVRSRGADGALRPPHAAYYAEHRHPVSLTLTLTLTPNPKPLTPNPEP